MVYFELVFVIGMLSNDEAVYWHVFSFGFVEINIEIDVIQGL
jgi:hypothetical protein